MICVSLPGPSQTDLELQLREAVAVADLVEFRLDMYDDPMVVRAVREHCALPFILTLRSQSQGGKFTGTQEEAVLILHSLLPLGPEYVDIEGAIPVDDWPPDVKIIRSHHDLSGTPDDLNSLLEPLMQAPASLYKIATTAHSTCDALRLLNFAKNQAAPLAVMAMGERGVCSRILGPVAGCPIVYAALSEALSTAPGQLTAAELREVYHFDTLNPSTALYGLIGDPIQQSIGHLVHNTYMSDFGAVYVRLQVAPEELASTLRQAVALGFRGFSVTIPHKEAVLPLLDEVDEEAREIGAVNTVTVRGGHLYGSNTDGKGALDALEAVTSIRGRRVVLLGAGGSIRAIAYEAKKRGAVLTILNRDVARAERLAGEFSVGYGPLDDFPSHDYDILINGTPNQMPIDAAHIRRGATVMDLSITPRETSLLKAAQKQGCSCVFGTDMFLRQAAEQAKTWFPDGLV